MKTKKESKKTSTLHEADEIQPEASQNEDYKEAYHRALADYQNLQKRTEREKEQIFEFSASVIITRFLEVFDNLTTAQNHLKDPGLELVINGFRKVFEDEGLQEIVIEPNTTEFDPHFHEAVTEVEGTPDGTIAEVIKKGFTIRDKVLRPATVVINRKNK